MPGASSSPIVLWMHWQKLILRILCSSPFSLDGEVDQEGLLRTGTVQQLCSSQLWLILIQMFHHWIWFADNVSISLCMPVCIHNPGDNTFLIGSTMVFFFVLLYGPLYRFLTECLWRYQMCKIIKIWSLNSSFEGFVIGSIIWNHWYPAGLTKA